MSETKCGRCGQVYDTERETPEPAMDSERCPKCGEENVPETELAIPTDGGMPDSLARIVEAVEERGGDVHIHFHEHRE